MNKTEHRQEPEKCMACMISDIISEIRNMERQITMLENMELGRHEEAESNYTFMRSFIDQMCKAVDIENPEDEYWNFLLSKKEPDAQPKQEIKPGCLDCKYFHNPNEQAIPGTPKYHYTNCVYGYWYVANSRKGCKKFKQRM